MNKDSFQEKKLKKRINLQKSLGDTYIKIPNDGDSIYSILKRINLEPVATTSLFPIQLVKYGQNNIEHKFYNFK